MTAKTTLRTCTIMRYTNGTRTIYDVMRGKMRGRYFQAHSAEVVGHFEVVGGKPADYLAMTAAYATVEAPAVYWQAAN